MFSPRGEATTSEVHGRATVRSKGERSKSLGRKNGGRHIASAIGTALTYRPRLLITTKRKLLMNVITLAPLVYFHFKFGI